MQIIKTLKSFGITAKVGKDPFNLDSEAFFMSLSDDRKKLLLNSKGRVEVVHGDKDFRQVILKVTEDARVIKYYPTGTLTRSGIIRQFRVRYNVPEATKYTYSKSQGLLTARLPVSTTYFLVGFDERHMFISELPQPVSTVAEAHKVLVPDEIRGKSYVRQGEFFLVPLSKEESDKLFRSLGYDDSRLGETIADSDHEASILIMEGNTEYVMGKIGNERHELYLDRLHRVYRNREVVRAGRFYD